MVGGYGFVADNAFARGVAADGDFRLVKAKHLRRTIDRVYEEVNWRDFSGCEQPGLDSQVVPKNPDYESQKCKKTHTEEQSKREENLSGHLSGLSRGLRVAVGRSLDTGDMGAVLPLV